jgi:DNA repair protein RadC
LIGTPANDETTPGQPQQRRSEPVSSEDEEEDRGDVGREDDPAGQRPDDWPNDTSNHTSKYSSNEPSKYRVPISAWRASDKPRSRLLRSGVENLTDAELLGLVFGSGVRTRTGPVSAVELGGFLLRRFGSLRELSTRDVREYLSIAGVGPAKAAQLAAVAEIGRRMEAGVVGERLQVGAPQDVVSAYAPQMRDLKKEVFKVVMLNTANYVTGDRVVSEGGLAVSIVEPRAVFRHAILENAAAIICLHNHPSGNPDPSREDVHITRQLAAAGRLMGVPVRDHIIIAGTSYSSLAEMGYL